ncbi:MAG: hypothetical protein LLG06_19705 [Desulfobacteraceae bacterium]|nr:hypothetical protein [Desulfobacteraceae bacterium]
MLKVLCEVCGEHIANTEIERLSYPWTGAMFDSPDPAHGVPDPFAPALDWEFARCPWGRTHRPWALDNQILTDQGVVVLPRGNGAAPQIVERGAPITQRQNIVGTVDTISDDMASQIVRSGMQGISDMGAEQDHQEQEPDISDEDAAKIARAAIAEGKQPNAAKIAPEMLASMVVCPVPGCGKAFSADRAAKQMPGHLRMKHQGWKDAAKEVEQ